MPLQRFPQDDPSLRSRAGGRNKAATAWALLFSAVLLGGVFATDLPQGLAYVSDDGGGLYVNNTWNVGTLANGASATLRGNTTVDLGQIKLPQAPKKLAVAALKDVLAVSVENQKGK